MSNIVIGEINGTARAAWRHTTTGVRKQSSSTWLVIAENQSTTEESIRTTSGLPQLYQVVSNVAVVGVEAKQVRPCKHPTTNVDTWEWHVDISWDSEVDQNLSLNPLLRDPEITTSGVLETGRLLFDAETGEIVQTAAGQAIFVPTPIVFPVINIKKYYAFGTFTPALISTLAGKSNSVAWRGIPIGNVQIQAPVVRDVTINATKYDEVQMAFKFVFDPNDPTKQNMMAQERVPHRGTWYIGPMGNILTTDRAGNVDLHDLNSDGTISTTGPQEIVFNAAKKINITAVLGV